jgi:probable phosphoglycerate mutase
MGPVAARLILIRHGETVWNHDGRFTTRSDIPLSDTGVAQADAAAEALAGTPIARIYSSPMRRALVTAETIAGRQPDRPPVRLDERLTEIDAGPFEGHTVSEIHAGPLAAEFAAWHRDDDPVFPPGTETFASAIDRARSFLAEVRDLPGVTLAATHGSLARVIVTALVIGADASQHRRLWMDNGRLAVIDWRDDGRPRLVGFNVTRP